MSDWKPIETAPFNEEIWATDGEWSAAIIVDPDTTFMWARIQHWAVCQEYDWGPTHWMPLPDLPKD